MNGLQLSSSSDKKKLLMAIEPSLINATIEPKAIVLFVKNSAFADFFLSEEAIVSLVDKLRDALTNNKMEPIEGVIGEARDAVIEITVSDDKMSAELTITCPYSGSVPNVKSLRQSLSHMSIVRGVSNKRLGGLIQQASQAKPGVQFTHTIAKGLPSKSGKDSYIKQLVPNALERVLAPKSNDGQKVDMRDFGELLCVKPNQAIAKRVAPGSGRNGFTVTGEPLVANAGEWKKIKLGDNVYVADDQINQILAKVSGLPKYNGDVVGIDDVYMSKGVNVATGNIKYSGAIIVNGDVTENMKIVADGDVTINGFVESAYIKSGGNIIITQGATGKMQDIDCQLIAAGSIFLEHGQGLHLDAGKQINVIKQLAYSNIKCKENLVVGMVDNPQGKLFASVISCRKSIIAGNLGAVSGSNLSIDYSDAFNQLCDRFDSMTQLFKDLSTKNADHEIKIAKINARVRSGQHDEKIMNLNTELELERVFLNWLRISKDELKHEIDDFEMYARVIATKALFPGVSLKLNKTNWETKKENGRCQIGLEEGKWIYSPMI